MKKGGERLKRRREKSGFRLSRGTDCISLHEASVSHVELQHFHQDLRMGSAQSMAT